MAKVTGVKEKLHSPTIRRLRMRSKRWQGNRRQGAATQSAYNAIFSRLEAHAADRP